MSTITLQIVVNGKTHTVEADPATPLLYVLRDHLQLNGPRFGCGLAQCGSCTVLMDGNAIRSCSIPVQAVTETEITTLEGIAQDAESLHPVQQAFVEEQAAQCGYCLNGAIMAAVALLRRNPDPNDEEIRNDLHGILCRCGAQARMIRAIKKVKG
ncbi:(2Fe-2S)-binding protein [Sinomicrobium weinanense]|uniref:(2Fe-2S)-binding protein n=1 Tax=Sinomicrobium weinanense TaxID=2842200 RepID=A0A926JS90_9FLAO|nr:(2Fe-2S)-binding protein [Sinomicrobium weinanense]MBC9796364.1 (2Fe-2S)-binding protein [Sinomicrobium weinanense]MBU3122434.1 (2Fe-2S)-binding protein [Sinomicrobium weinanense]